MPGSYCCQLKNVTTTSNTKFILSTPSRVPGNHNCPATTDRNRQPATPSFPVQLVRVLGRSICLALDWQRTPERRPAKADHSHHCCVAFPAILLCHLPQGHCIPRASGREASTREKDQHSNPMENVDVAALLHSRLQQRDHPYVLNLDILFRRHWFTGDQLHAPAGTLDIFFGGSFSVNMHDRMSIHLLRPQLTGLALG